MDTGEGGYQRGSDYRWHLHRPIAVGIELRGHCRQDFDSFVGGRHSAASCPGDAQCGAGVVPIRVLSPVPADSQGNRTERCRSRHRQRLLASMDAGGRRADRQRRRGPRSLRGLYTPTRGRQPGWLTSSGAEDYLTIRRARPIGEPFAAGTRVAGGSAAACRCPTCGTVPGRGARLDNWRRCRRCQGLFEARPWTSGYCPAGGGHDYTGSVEHDLRFSVLPTGG
jgi:hypothetical protein